MLEPQSLLLIAIVVIVAFLIKSATGFGENLLMIPLLSLILDLKLVLPLTLTIVLVADGYLLYRFYAAIQWQVFWRFIIPALAGIILGTLGLQYIEEAILEKALGGIVIIYALTTLIWPFKPINNDSSKILNYAAGFFGGGLSGLLGIGGPPVIAYLTHHGVTKAVFRATCVITFLSFDLFRLVSYSWKGYFTMEIFLYGLALIPAFGIGSYLGIKLHPKLNEQLFKTMVAVLLIGVGVSLLVSP